MVTRKPKKQQADVDVDAAQAFIAAAPDARSSRARAGIGGRKKKYSSTMRTLSVQISAQDYEKFLMTAVARGTTMTQIVQRCVHHYIQRHRRAADGELGEPGEIG